MRYVVGVGGTASGGTVLLALEGEARLLVEGTGLVIEEGDVADTEEEGLRPSTSSATSVREVSIF